MNENVLREFLVSLGFRVDETGLKKFTTAVEGVTKGVLAAGAAVAATATGIVASVKIISSQMENLYYASQRTGATVGNLMALRYAAGQIGLTADQAQGALEGFARTLRLNPGSNSLLSSLGVGGADPTEKFDNFIAKMKEQQPYVAAAYAQLFGIDPDTLLMLEQGQQQRLDSEERFRAKLAAFHIDPDQAATAGKDFDNSVRDLQSDVHLFFVLLQEHLAPVLSTIATQFEKWELGHADQVAGKIADALKAVAEWVSKINWTNVGKDVDTFIDKATRVAEIIGNIVNGVIRVADWFGGDVTHKQGPTDPTSGDPQPGDSAFTAWVRSKRAALEDWAMGSNAVDMGNGPDDWGGDAGGGNNDMPQDVLNAQRDVQQNAYQEWLKASPAGRKAIEDVTERTYSEPRGIRNNNPGNLRYGDFARGLGATGQDTGGFAIFGSMQQGVRAALHLLESYAARGADTIRKIISKWAPPSENNTSAYIESVAKKLGISADAHLNNDQLGGVAQAIFGHENGAAYGNVRALVDRSSNTRLGSVSATPNVSMHQTNEFHVTGTGDPQGTARAISAEQSRINGDLVRNFAGAVR